MRKEEKQIICFIVAGHGFGGDGGPFVDDVHLLGVWMNVPFSYLPNRRGGQNLVFNGYLYTSERKYNTTINWVCNKNSNLHLKCPARCVTSGDSSIKLSKKLHNHEAIYPQIGGVGGGGVYDQQFHATTSSTSLYSTSRNKQDDYILQLSP